LGFSRLSPPEAAADREKFNSLAYFYEFTPANIPGNINLLVALATATRGAPGAPLGSPEFWLVALAKREQLLLRTGHPNQGKRGILCSVPIPAPLPAASCLGSRVA